MQLLGGAMSVIDWNGEARNILKAVRAVGYLEGMYDVAVVRKWVA